MHINGFCYAKSESGMISEFLKLAFKISFLIQITFEVLCYFCEFTKLFSSPITGIKYLFKCLLNECVSENANIK